ncbi:MAG: hypothetical protein DRJ10_08350 [Bacteroidetes bacterium]|nr:MAG: hypothetical protein DRJ10_08350 [Bacteroidota bacterium]
MVKSKHYYCTFFESCGSPVEGCLFGMPSYYTIPEHIYYTKRVGEQFKVKLLCSDEWIYVDHVCPMKNHVSKGYHVHGIRQWSMGAGHNTTCPKCLIKFAQRKLKTDFVFQQKLIEYAKPDPTNEREDKMRNERMIAIYCKQCHGMIFACEDEPMVILDSASAIKKYKKHGHHMVKVSKHEVKLNFTGCLSGCTYHFN